MPALAALAALCLAFPHLARAEPVAATYRVHVGGVAVLDVSATLDLTGRSYRLEVAAETRGFLGTLFPWRTLSRSDGAVAGDRLLPAHHRQNSVLRDKPRTVALDYDAQGNVTASVEPPPKEDDREPVPDDLRRSTHDPLSAFLTVMAAAARGEPCTRSLPVFDGRRRYDMIFRDVGQRLVGASRYSVFAGSARQCQIAYRPVAGYARSAPSGGFWQRDSGPTERPPVDLWLAPIVPGAPPLPVRLETDSDLGAVVIHLVGVTPPGVLPTAPR